jgi:hypothetical protein
VADTRYINSPNYLNNSAFKSPIKIVPSFNEVSKTNKIMTAIIKKKGSMQPQKPTSKPDGPRLLVQSKKIAPGVHFEVKFDNKRQQSTNSSIRLKHLTPDTENQAGSSEIRDEVKLLLCKCSPKPSNGLRCAHCEGFLNLDLTTDFGIKRYPQKKLTEPMVVKKVEKVEPLASNCI